MDKDVERQQEETPEKEPRKKPYGLLLGMIALVTLAIVCVSAYKDGTGFDAMRRYLLYGIRADDDSVEYIYDDGTDTQFALLDDSLVALSATKLEIQVPGGTVLWSTPVKMRVPALKKGNDYVVAYDVGGTDAYVVNKDGLVKAISMDSGNLIISATLNENDYLALTHQAQGYKGSVSVYNSDLDLIFDFNSSRRYVSNGYVSHDNQTLVAVTLGEEAQEFVTNLVYYHLNETSSFADCDLVDGLVVEVEQHDTLLVTLTDTGLYYASLDGEIHVNYDFQGSYLREYDCTGEDFSALLLNRYQSGNTGTLVSVDHTGQELGRLNVDSEVMDISVSGRYISVLYSNQLVMYTSEFVEYAVVSQMDYGYKVLTQSDGSVVVFAREQAQILAP